MSRKALFANLQLGSAPASDGKVTAATDDLRVNEKSDADPVVRAATHKTRPILGSSALIKSAAAPVGALGQSLSEFKAQSERALAIERQLAEGQVVVDLDPTLIDPSFVEDRMATSREAHARLVEAIRDHGQQVPILVRPHPSVSGRFQVAYGHRRLRAALNLQRTVRAVVKSLSDDELVIAQGQENNERQDLSFIEKARFARSLEQRGFKRDTIMTALSVYKSDLSNMLSVISRVPENVIHAIGPSLGIGRRGWIDLAERFSDPAVAKSVKALIASPDFLALESDQRFRRVHALVRPSVAERPRLQNWTTAEGAKLGKIVQDAEKISVTIDRRVAPEFGDFVLERLQALYEEFKSRR